MSAIASCLRRLAPVSADGVRPDRALAWVNVGLIALVAWLSAGLVWSVTVPIGAVGASVARAAAAADLGDITSLVRFDPFSRAASAEAGAPDIAQLGLTLFAVRVGGAGGGAAVISNPTDGQRSFSVGEAVAPGVSLQSVTADHAVLEQAGQTFRLAFPNAPAPFAAPAEGSVGTLQVARTIDPSAFLGELALQARVENGEVTGYRLREGSVGPIARRLGLRPGDVLTALNNTRLSDDERLADMHVELTSRPEAVLHYERDGQSLTATLRIATP